MDGSGITLFLELAAAATAAAALFFGIRSRDRRSPLEKLIDGLHSMRVDHDAGQILAETMEKAALLLQSGPPVLLYYDANDEQLYRCSVSSARQLAIAEIPALENVEWILFGQPVHVERLDAAAPLSGRLNARTLLSIGHGASGSCVRLLVPDAGAGAGPRSAASLPALAQLLLSLAHRVFLLRRVHSQAVDQERARIAQDFHDGPLQTFFSFDVHLQFIRQILARDPERAAVELLALQEMAREQGRELREILMEMRPVDMEGATLGNVIRHAVEGSQKGGGVQVRLLTGDHHLDVPRKICRQTYQVLREALTNARKHARAQHVLVKLEEGADFFVLTVDDDGHGFKFAGAFTLEEMERQRIGPVSIKQRAREMGADLTVESSPGKGARLTLRVPVPLSPPRSDREGE